MAAAWRIVVICSIKPLADTLVGALRDLGHEPVALLAPRRDGDRTMPPHLRAHRRERPDGARPSLRTRQARDRAAPARVRARPDALLGLPLEDPAGRARRAAARLREHAPGPAAAPPRADPARLGAARRRLRVGGDLAPHGRRARHRQPARTGIGADRGRRRRHRAVLAEAAGARGRAAPARARARRGGRSRAIRSRPRARAGQGTSRTTTTCASTGRSRPASIHDQVRAWHLTFGFSGLRAPVAELDGEQVVLLRTRLTDPGGGARRVECGDGPIWVVASEPV